MRDSAYAFCWNLMGCPTRVTPTSLPGLTPPVFGNGKTRLQVNTGWGNHVEALEDLVSRGVIFSIRVRKEAVL